jgi:hypothetical protein
MILRLRGCVSMVLGCTLCLSLGATGIDARAQAQKPKAHPKVTVRANPEMGIAPMRVVATAELNGGADDDQQYYCLKVQWQWGDDSESTTEADCDPYVPGKSEIKRHFAVEHRYMEPGRYELRVLFLQGDKVIDSGRAIITASGEVAPGPAAATPPAPHGT